MEDQGRARVTALLRGSVGCSQARLLHLNEEELERCAKSRAAHVDPDLEIPAPIAPEKRAWFDATVAARKEPDHPPAVVCFAKPPHGVRLWPLPCSIEPKGLLSEDVDTPPEPEHSR